MIFASLQVFVPGLTVDLAAVLSVDVGIVVALAVSLVLLTARLRKIRQLHQDLLAATRNRDSMAAQELIMREAALNADDGIVVQDLQARILWANPAYCRTMGVELGQVLGRRPQEFCFPPEIKPSAAEIAAFRFDPDSYEFKGLVRRKNMRQNGERFWHEFSLSMVKLDSGEDRVILVGRDVTPHVEREQELERARADLHRAAHHDALTGLNNRSVLLKSLDTVLSGSAASQRTMGLFYIDLDRFKAVNDQHGHAAGDRLLSHVADALRATMGPDDLACRMGGDEFVMACPGHTDFAELELIADALLERLAAPIPWQDTWLKCNASIGIAVACGEATTAEDLIRSADFALYEAKAPGAQRIACYNAELHAKQEAETALLEEFAEALDDGTIDFAYQPILDANTGRIRSFEALARWQRKTGERVAPDVFLPLATRLNRVAEVDFAAIRATALLVAELSARGYAIRGAFNTSSDSLAHPDFLERLEFEARDAGLRPDELVAEVLETTFFGPDTTHSAAAARISELRARGFAVYLDDFGVGYAGLAHLSQLDISGIKLDRSLVANVGHDASAQLIATSILRLCDELGIGTLAEGIETAEQAHFLSAHGCFRQQGFGIARPMPRQDLIALVEAAPRIVIPPEIPQGPTMATGRRARILTQSQARPYRATAFATHPIAPARTGG